MSAKHQAADARSVLENRVIAAVEIAVADLIDAGFTLADAKRDIANLCRIALENIAAPADRVRQ
jgi:hypothetical protein